MKFILIRKVNLLVALNAFLSLSLMEARNNQVERAVESPPVVTKPKVKRGKTIQEDVNNLIYFIIDNYKPDVTSDFEISSEYSMKDRPLLRISTLFASCQMPKLLPMDYINVDL